MGRLVRLQHGSHPELPLLAALDTAVGIARGNEDNRAGIWLGLGALEVMVGISDARQYALEVDQRVHARNVSLGAPELPAPRQAERYELLRHPDFPLLCGALGVATQVRRYDEATVGQIFNEYMWTGRTDFRDFRPGTGPALAAA